MCLFTAETLRCRWMCCGGSAGKWDYSKLVCNQQTTSALGVDEVAANPSDSLQLFLQFFFSHTSYTMRTSFGKLLFHKTCVRATFVFRKYKPITSHIMHPPTLEHNRTPPLSIQTQFLQAIFFPLLLPHLVLIFSFFLRYANNHFSHSFFSPLLRCNNNPNNYKSNKTRTRALCVLLSGPQLRNLVRFSVGLTLSLL